MEDLAPLPVEQRNWSWRTFAALWAAMSFQPAAYSIGGSLFALGLSAAESLAITAVGSLLTAIFIVINSAPGVRWGIPFPVYARASFGTSGAKAAALSRGVVGVMWLSFQLWLSGNALVQGLAMVLPAAAGDWAPIHSPYLNTSQLLALLFSAATCCMCISIGVKHFKKWLYIAAPFGIAFFLCIAVWAASPSLSGLTLAEELEASGATSGRAPFARIIGLNAVLSFWSTVMMNAADLSRMAPRQADQVVGQLLGIPVPMTITVAVGIFGSAAVQLKSGQVSWMTVDVFAYWPPLFGAVGGVIIFFLLLSVNIAANIIPPANDFLNLFPDSLRWRTCAYGTVCLAILICPFYLFHSPTGFVIKFLGGYGMVTGSLYGVMVSDYFVVRGRQLSLEDLYAEHGRQGAYSYYRGHNWRAALATIAGVLLPMPEWIAGFFGASGELPAAFVLFGGSSWFVAASVSAAVYVLACWLRPPPLGTLGKGRQGAEDATSAGSGSDTNSSEGESSDAAQ